MRIIRNTALLFAMALLTVRALLFVPNAHAVTSQAPAGEAPGGQGAASQTKKKSKSKNKNRRKKLILKSRHSKHSRRPA